MDCLISYRYKDNHIHWLSVFSFRNVNLIEIENKLCKTILHELSETANHFLKETMKNFETLCFLRSTFHLTLSIQMMFDEWIYSTTGYCQVIMIRNVCSNIWIRHCHALATLSSIQTRNSCLIFAFKVKWYPRALDDFMSWASAWVTLTWWYWNIYFRTSITITKLNCWFTLVLMESIEWYQNLLVWKASLCWKNFRVCCFRHHWPRHGMSFWKESSAWVQYLLT
jgi:hypothetical protein